jgi:amino acid transporter
MSAIEGLPTESSSPGRAQPERLARGVLSTFDIAASTLANIAPAMSFYFGFAFIVATSGIAAPLTVIAAAIAIALLGNTVSQFSMVKPSTGSFVSFIGSTFGGYAGVVAAVVTTCGYIIAISSVIAISGAWTETILNHYFSVNIPWQIFTLILTVGAGLLITAGAKPSTKVAGLAFLFELVLLLGVSVVLLIQHSGHINAQPFNPSNLHNGFSGLSLGFPLCIYLFIGWESSVALAEESHDPRHAVPRAVFLSVAVIAVVYIFLTYSTVVGFDQNAGALTASDVPFVTAATGVGSLVLFLCYIAGFTSILGSLIGATNAQARILFSAGREGLLPSVVGRVTAKQRTPYMAFIVFLGIGLGLSFIFGSSGGTAGAINFFGQISTLGTMLILVAYLFTNLALPFYMRRHHADRFNMFTHLVLPLLGVFAVGFPLEQLAKPGQEAPFNLYPWIALGVIIVGAIYAAYVYRKDPTISERVGSIVADVE